MNTVMYSEIRGEGFVFDHKIIECATPDDFPPHIHTNCELLFFIRGNVSYRIEGRSYKLKKGDLVFSRPSVFHNIFPEDGTLYERYNIIYDEELLPNEIKERIPQGVDVFSFGDNPKIFDLFEKLDSYKEYFSANTVSRLASHIIEELFCNLAITNDFSQGESLINPLIGKALSYIDENLTTVKNIDEICQSLYITKSHLHHLFIEYIRVSPKKYITSKRLLLARKLMKYGKKPTEAAIAAGFDDYATFYRNYKKSFGFTPSEQN